MRGGKPVLAGRPISNTQIYILDRDLQPVPVGVSGQLCVAGHGLAAGYLGRPEQTAEKFISNPFESGTRLYLTGDLARFRSDGNIELLGRIDHQVKIRGFRVELGEIETLLREHPAVKQALVTSRDDDQGAKRLVAYLVQQTDHAQTNWKRDPHAVPEGCAATSAEQSHESWASCTNDSLKSRALIATLRQFLKDCVPEYMLPSDFVVLQSLPMTPSGKVDRTALTALVKAPTDVADNLVEPRTPTEQVIRDVWREVLQIEQVSVHDNFFDLGGHSLLLASVHSRLMKIFDRQLPSTDLYQYPTISALAARLGNSNLDQRPLDAARERAAKQRDSRLRRTALLSQK
jgi:acyl carrier protein